MALVVNNKQTYPPVAKELVRTGGAQSAIHELEVITRQAWPSLGDELLDEAADILIGTYDNVITVVYLVKSWQRDDDNKLWFEVAPAVEHVGLIGTAQPGGPWRRGEARGTRRVHVDHPAPDFQRTWVGAVVEVAQRFAPARAKSSGRPARVVRPAGLLALEDVRVSVDDQGRVVVDVPVGAEVLVRSAPSA